MRSVRICALLLLVAPGLACAEPKFYLKDGDRVVFYGDSITERRLYSQYVETYVVTRFPKLDVTFVHSGWGGDRVTGGAGGPINVRLRRDVLAYKPTVMTILLGMNDAEFRPFEPHAFEVYTRGYKAIVDALKREAPGLRLTLIEPSPHDDVTRPPSFAGGYNATLVRYGTFVKELAARSGALAVDFNKPLVDATTRAYDLDPGGARKLNPDRIHPGPGGNLILAAALLEAWNAPALVSVVQITAEDGRLASREQNTEVSELALKDGVLTWTQLDEVLPFPLDMKDESIRVAIKSSDVLAKIDQELLQVKGLGAAEYTLAIDGGEVGAYTKPQLAEGINLATRNTPMTRQAAAVHLLTLQHNNLHYSRWRQLEFPLQDDNLPHLPDALKGLDALEADIVVRQHEAAQPKPHRYELRPRS